MRSPSTSRGRRDEQRDSAPDERRPLLAGLAQEPSPAGGELEAIRTKKRRGNRATPLPKVQMLTLGLMRLSEPITFTMISPFINQMILEIGLTHDPAQVGYYAGLVQSAFSFCQFFCIFFWGKLSDRIGRRPVLVLGLTGISISVLCFGLSKTFWQVIVARCLAGVLNGNIAVIKSVIGEITDVTNQARGFSLIPLCVGVGGSIGPLIGGYLSHPYERYPEVFGNITFLKTYPFFLPCFVAALLLWSSITLGLLFLKETLPPSQRKRAKEGQRSGRDDQEESTSKVPFSPWRDQRTRWTLISFAVLTFSSIGSEAACLTLFFFSLVRDGGLEWSMAQIGAAMSVGGVCMVVVQVLVFPPMERRWGATRLYQACIAFRPVIYCLLPLSNAIARASAKASEDGGVDDGLGNMIIYGIVGVVMALRALAHMSFSCNMILVNRCAPAGTNLGALNAVAQMVSSAMRFVGPATLTSLYAFSVQTQLLNGYFMWACLLVVCVASIACSWMLPSDDDEEEEEEEEEEER